MTTVNKILSGLILISAIACCILSTILYQQRIELRNRADYLSKVSSQTAEIIDSQGELSTEIDISQTINRQSLSWQAYKEARNEEGLYTHWEEKVDKLPQAAEKLVTMKQVMADKMISFSQKIHMPQNDGELASLNSSLTFKSHLELIDNYLENYKQKKDSLHSGLEELAIIFKYDNDFSEKASLEQLKKHISALTRFSSDVITKKELLCQNMQELAKNFTEDENGEVLFTPSWKHINFTKANSEEMRQGFALITKDLQLLNNKLNELKVVSRLVEEQRSQLAVKDNVIQELNHENDQLKNTNGSQKATITRISRELAEFHAQKDATIPEDIQAQVIEVNDRFNFLVINKGRKNGLIAHADLLIHNDGKYVCKARISKVLNDKAICDILPNPGNQVEVKLPTAGNTAVSAK